MSTAELRPLRPPARGQLRITAIGQMFFDSGRLQGLQPCSGLLFYLYRLPMSFLKQLILFNAESMERISILSIFA